MRLKEAFANLAPELKDVLDSAPEMGSAAEKSKPCRLPKNTYASRTSRPPPSTSQEIGETLRSKV
jgi:hypothetical protein